MKFLAWHLSVHNIRRHHSTPIMVFMPVWSGYLQMVSKYLPLMLECDLDLEMNKQMDGKSLAKTLVPLHCTKKIFPTNL